MGPCERFDGCASPSFEHGGESVDCALVERVVEGDEVFFEDGVFLCCDPGEHLETEYVVV